MLLNVILVASKAVVTGSLVASEAMAAKRSSAGARAFFATVASSERRSSSRAVYKWRESVRVGGQS